MGSTGNGFLTFLVTLYSALQFSVPPYLLAIFSGGMNRFGFGEKERMKEVEVCGGN